MCDVDLLVISENQVRVIVEIEESGFLPTKICGKFLQSAIATHFIHDSRAGSAIPYGNRVLFVQVLDGSKIPMQSSRKILQGRMIERQIRNMLPFKGISITDYCLFYIRSTNYKKDLELVGATVSKALTK